MDREVELAVRRIQPILEADLRSSIEAVVRDHDPYGYALLLGEDLDQSTPSAVTNAERDLDGVRPDYATETRYFPDEWVNWHSDQFSQFNNAFRQTYLTLEAHHSVTNDDFTYTSEALDFMRILYELYLETMMKVSPDYPSISYWIIGISDSGRSIIKQSFFKLNSGRALAEASSLFSDF